jgi:hypothetical protein|eukprot:COSAG06_NODE_3585_length_5149_cov_2.336436_2_plen_137_part_00
MEVSDGCRWLDCDGMETSVPPECGEWQTIDDEECLTWNAPDDPNFVGFNRTIVELVCADPSLAHHAEAVGELDAWLPANVNAWCGTCVLAATGEVNPLTQRRQMQDNVSAMGAFDWVVLGFAMLMVALGMCFCTRH